MVLPASVPPGSRVRTTARPCCSNHSRSSSAWVVLPDPSPPSKVIQRPSVMCVLPAREPAPREREDSRATPAPRGLRALCLFLCCVRGAGRGGLLRGGGSRRGLLFVGLRRGLLRGRLLRGRGLRGRLARGRALLGRALRALVGEQLNRRLEVDVLDVGAARD